MGFCASQVLSVLFTFALPLLFKTTKLEATLVPCQAPGVKSLP